MAAMKTTENISTRRTYYLLQNGLFGLLQITPFEKITLKELCSCSMVPRSTFYRYFEDKNDLLRYCLGFFFDSFQLSADIIYLKDEESIRSFLLHLIEQLSKNKDMYYKIYRINREGIMMDMIKQYLTVLLTAKMNEADANGAPLKISSPVFVYLLTDFYISVAKCYLDSSDESSTEAFVNDVYLFSCKDFF